MTSAGAVSRFATPAAAARLGLCSLITALNLWVAQGALLPVTQDAQGLDYLLVSPSLPRLCLDWVLVLAALLAWHLAMVRRRQQAPGGAVFTGENTRYLTPLLLLAFGLLPLANLFEPLAGRLSSWSFVLFDLRGWWWPLVALAVVRRSGVPITAWTARLAGRVRGVWSDLLLGVLVLAGVLAATPRARWVPLLVGDEPKYIRYCENFYQGLGFDIARIQRVADLPRSYRPRVLENVRGFAAAIPEEIANLRQDLQEFARGRTRFNRARYTGSWFIAGKRPDSVYQIHQPGLSLLLFAAYYLDRRVVDPPPDQEGKLPARLPIVHGALVALFALYAVALHRLLGSHTTTPGLAFVLALLAALSMPIGAFAFQVYPEIAAGLASVLVVRFLLDGSPRPLWRAIGCGALAGFLFWLHVRLALTALALLGWALAGWRRDRLAAAAFAGGFLVPAVGWCLYAYRLTGSLLPTAMYDTRGGVFTLGEALRGLPIYLIDHSWGIFAHAPIYLLALPGLALAWQRRPRAAALAALVLGATALSSSGHDVTAGGTTPARYLVAAIPLLMLFVADAAERWRNSRVFGAAFVTTGLLSLECAAAYSRYHTEDSGLLVTWGFSGWRLNQLFPDLTRFGLMQRPSYVLLLASWWLVIGWLVLVGIRAARRRPTGQRAQEMSPAAWAFPLRGADLVAGFAGLALAGTIASAAKGDWFRTDYLMPAAVARDRALEFHARQGRCTLCATTRDGEVDPGARFGPTATEFRLEIERPVTAGRPTALRAVALAAGQVRAWGTLRIDFGDGSGEKVPAVLGEAVVHHAFRVPGTRHLRAWFLAADGRSLPWEEVIEVGPAP